MGHSETIVYKGVHFRRYPESKARADRVYFVPGKADRMRGVGRLHQEMWRDHHGNIPDGHVIHHIDGNPLNNDISNLQCVESTSHLKHHGAINREALRIWFAPRQPALQEMAKAWHRSEVGRAWHREHARKLWETKDYTTQTCQHCGASYETCSKHGKSKFCSNNCKSAARRASGVDNEIRTCERCGKAFSCNKYSKSRYCSRSCGSGFHYSRR